MYIYIFFPYPNIGLSSLSLFYVAALSFFPVFSLFYIQPYLFFPFPLLTYNLALSFLCLFVFRVRHYCFFFPVTASYTKPYLFFSLFFSVPDDTLVFIFFSSSTHLSRKALGGRKKKTYKRRALFPFSPELFFPFPCSSRTPFCSDVWMFKE